MNAVGIYIHGVPILGFNQLQIEISQLKICNRLNLRIGNRIQRANCIFSFNSLCHRTVVMFGVKGCY